ncbi:MAG: hypothetical protein C0404_14645 [Verrucomicrobia bacterium]|nr:hypothetical protein [Verrucomicrobiota bacterium]
MIESGIVPDRQFEKDLGSKMKKPGAILLCSVALILAGCEGGGDDSGANGNASTASIADVAGTWDGASASIGDSGTLALTLSGLNVAGTFSTRSGYSGNISGSVSGSRVTMELVYPSGQSTLSATISGKSMSGTFAARSGQSGSFTATKR